MVASLVLVLAAAFTQVLAVDFCDDYLPRVAHDDTLQNVIREYNHYKDDDVTQSRAVNVHDAWSGCTDLQTDDLLHVSLDCYPPEFDIISTVNVYIPADRNFPPGLFCCVRLLDRSEDSTGAVPVITAGGAGHDFVRYTITGQPSHGFKHLVQLYWRNGTDWTTEGTEGTTEGTEGTTDGTDEPDGAGALTALRGLVVGALLVAITILRLNV